MFMLSADTPVRKPKEPWERGHRGQEGFFSINCEGGDTCDLSSLRISRNPADSSRTTA